MLGALMSWTSRMDVKWCRHQHQVLVTYIRYTLQYWGPVDDPSVSYWIMGDSATPLMRHWRIQVTPELKRVLMRARILSEACSMELPLHKALLWLDDWSQEFVDIVKEIQWCTSVVYNGKICSNVTRSLPQLKDFPWQAKIGYHENFLLEIAKQKDMEQPEYRIQHKCSAEDCGNMHDQIQSSYCLVHQAVLRYIREDSDSDHKSLLWKFDPEVVRHGRPLGSGSFGFVTEVTWLGFNFARKIFNASRLEYLRAEGEALAKLNHPHIVKLYAYAEDSLLMDLMSTDLHKFMSGRMRGGARLQPFSLRAAMDLMLQIADAVSYIHSQNVAHRDLKSSNILVNMVNTPCLTDEDDGFVFAKIADFGLAKTKRDITRYSHLTHDVGTRRWMAPEIFGANIEDDHLEHAFPMKADVYSFGMVCFEILTGEEPFKDELFGTLYSKLTAPIPLRPQLPSSCPTSLASLIFACWDADPRKRPAFGDVCRVLRYLKGLPTLIAFNDVLSVVIDRAWPFGRLTPIVKKQGPWGDSCNILQEGWIHRSSEWLDDIKAVQFLFNDHEKLDLSGFKILGINYGGREMERSTGGDPKASSDWIHFQDNEFLVQVEGSILENVVVSLNFITTRQKYESSIPSLTSRQASGSFRSDHGRVVGFNAVSKQRGDSSSILTSLEVHTIPNIVECLRQYLGNEE